MFKKLQLHVLPTDIATDFGQCIKNMSDVKVGEWKKIVPMMMSLEYWKPHHLYLTSQDEIKEGDWFINGITGQLNQSRKGFRVLPSRDRKIVATTNPDLWWDESDIKYGGEPELTSIKVIPQLLIEYFVQQQGNVKEVMVEYEPIEHLRTCGTQYRGCDPQCNYQKFVDKGSVLRLTPSGEIIWKPVEEKMYTSSEIMRKLEELHPGIMDENYTNPFIYRGIEKWYEELKKE